MGRIELLCGITGLAIVLSAGAKPVLDILPGQTVAGVDKNTFIGCVDEKGPIPREGRVPVSGKQTGGRH